MKQSKRTLFILCSVGVFLFVYGTAVILRLILGRYLLDGGLGNLNYALLAFLCAIPFLFYLLISRNQVERVAEVIMTSGFFFITLFVYVNFMLVLSSTEKLRENEIRLLITFPVVALILLVVFRLVQSSNSGWKEIK